MVKVYFETSSYCHQVAIFDDEETYAACTPALEELMKKHGYEFMSESVEEGSTDGSIKESEGTPAPNPQVERVLTIGDLRKALEQFDDNDQVVVEIHEGVRHEDLYTFYVDHMDGLRDVEGNEFKEVRLCI